MKINSSKSLNTFVFFKLPSAYFCGIRVTEFSPSKCVAKVRHRWINQNPFQSLYFAVQAMAAELTTGALVMHHIQKSEQKISMLVTQNKSIYTKKARGKIQFICDQGDLIKATIDQAIISKEGQTIWLKSIGKDELGDTVSEMEFCWSLKVK